MSQVILQDVSLNKQWYTVEVDVDTDGLGLAVTAIYNRSHAVDRMRECPLYRQMYRFLLGNRDLLGVYDEDNL